MASVGKDPLDMVGKFCKYFYKNMAEGNLEHMTQMYEVTFPKLSEDFFKTKPWPHPDGLKHIVNDYLFWMLYQELYFRHLHSLAAKKTGLITLQHRKSMWDNYVSLFDVLNSADAPLKLPPIWLWDMIDEFLYQFQTFRALAGQANQQADTAFLKANPDAWAPDQVQAVLEAFVSKAGIRDEVAADNCAQIFATGGLIGRSNVRRMLAYFSLVGLCRFHSVMGRHDEALRALSPLNPYNRQHLFTFKVPMANVNLYYYAGVAYLMLERYIDAGRCFNTVLSFLLRVKQTLKKNQLYDLLLHKNEQLYKLLAITTALCPSVARWCEDAVSEQLRNKCQDQMLKMQSGDIETYKVFFAKACPRFVSPTGPDLEGETDTSMLGFVTQQAAFLAEVQAVHQLPDLKKFLKLYTSISMDKLAQLLSTDVDTLRSVLQSMQQRIMQKRWVTGEAIAGEAVATTDIDFKLGKDETGQDVVVVVEQRVVANHLATLAKHIVRFEQITKDMDTLANVPTVAAAAAAR